MQEKRDTTAVNAFRYFRRMIFRRGLFKSMRSRAMKAGLVLLIFLTISFIALPVASLFLRSPMGTVLHSLKSPMVADALRLSISTAAVTTITIVILGTPLAYVNARFRYPGKEIVDSVIDLPVIMPPAVAGIALLMAFGRMGIVGQHLNAMGISVAFTTLAVIIAQMFVSSPFTSGRRRPALKMWILSLENAARTLGASQAYTFFHVVLPIAYRGLVSGAIMAFARSLGEFGATIMFAGNFQGRTQTMPLAIYTAMQGDLDAALCLAIILVIISFLVIFLVRALSRRMYENAGN